MLAQIWRRALICPGTALVLLASGPGRTHGQAASPALCPAGTISEIFVDNHSVFDPSDPDVDARFAWAYRTANRLHTRTREGVIRREILVDVGDCYDPDLLEDSERLLRNSHYIAGADVYGIRQADGSYHVVVDTRDEWSLRVEPQLDSRAGGLGGLELREDNLFGTARSLALFAGSHFDEPVYGGVLFDPQLLGSQLDLTLGASRTAPGHGFVQAVAHPFRGEAGRWAFRQRVVFQDRYFDYLTGGASGRSRVLLPQQRLSADAVGVLRLGRRGNLSLFGVGLAGEWIAYPGEARYWDPAARDSIAAADLPQRTGVGLDSAANVHLVFLAGQRNVYFERRRALDAVSGEEDVQLGFEAEVGIGRSLQQLSSDDEMALNLGLFAAGAPTPSLIAGARATVEARRDFDAPMRAAEWSDVFGQLRAWSYWRRGDSRHTWVAALTAAGGWNVGVPYQTTLGAWSGLRGYRRHAFPGHRRAVATLEDRIDLRWPLPHLIDVGAAVFADVGRIWPGGDVYGVDSGFRADVGLGLRTAFPAGSRRTYRVDVATPVGTGSGFGSLVFTVSVGETVGRAFRDDRHIRRSSRRALAASLFNFPD